MYETRQPNTATFRYDGTRGALVRRHRTLEAAIASIEREQRAVKRRPGGERSYVQRFVTAPDGRIVYTSGC